MMPNFQAIRRKLKLFTRTPTLLPGIVLFLLIVLPATVGRLFVDVDLARVGASELSLPPSLAHPLGTQSEGRDMLVLLIIGTSATLKIGLIGGGLGVAIGTCLGLISGYSGGRLDSIIRNIVDIGLTIPPLALLIMIAASFKVVTVEMMGLVVACTAWMHPTRVVRSQVLSLRERSFVQLSKLSNASDLQIAFFELMPNLIPFLAATLVNSVSTAILSSVGLEVLGLGSQQTLSLGMIIYYAIYYSAMWRGLWWWWLPPIVVMMVLFLSLFLMSITLDEFANPRLRRL